MTTLEDKARAAAENCWPMGLDGLPGNQPRKERELMRRGYELGYAAALRRQGPITDEVVDAALDAYAESAGLLRDQRMRAALEAAERVRFAVPCVECSGTGWLATHQRDGSATADSCRDCGGSGLRAVPSPTEQEDDR